MPHVSVIIPTWNRAERLTRAIESVLEQTYRDFELWVVDDGSDDITQKLLEKHKDQLKTLMLTSNRGVSTARNAGIRSILVEPQFSPRLAITISGEFGGRTVMVDPLGDVNDSARSGYEKLILFNSRAFAQALGGMRN